MGNSSRTTSSVDNDAFTIGKEENEIDHDNSVKKFKNAIDDKNVEQIAKIIAPHVIGSMPNGSSKLPIYMGAKIAYDIYKSENTEKYTKTKFSSSVASISWDFVEEKVEEEGVNKSLMTFCEPAFKRTVSEMVYHGSDAII